MPAYLPQSLLTLYTESGLLLSLQFAPAGGGVACSDGRTWWAGRTFMIRPRDSRVSGLAAAKVGGET